MFLLCQHENRKHQFGRQYRFYEHASRQTRIRTQRRPHIQRRRKHDFDEKTRKNTPRQLGNQQQREANRRHSARQQHCKSDGGIEQAAADAEENPHVDHEGEGEDEGDVLQDLGRETRVRARGRVVVVLGVGVDVGDLGSREGEEEEHGGADEFADEGYEVWGKGYNVRITGCAGKSNNDEEERGRDKPSVAW